MTRRILAVRSVSTVLFLYVSIFISFILKLIDYTQFNQLLSAMTIPNAIAAAALIFYFSGKAISSSGRKARKVLKALK